MWLAGGIDLARNGSGEGEEMAALLGITLAAQAVLFGFTAISFLAPAHRVWPPPSRSSWQFYGTWSLSWVALSGVFLLALLGGNSLGLPAWLRVGLGVPLLGLGVGLIAWGFRALSVPTSVGLPGALIRSGPYRFSRNPQYLGTCLYLGGLAVASGSHLAALGCLAVGLWFAATPFVEEPWLAERFGAEYESYCQAVPRFIGLRQLASGRC
jgi:protein-S-isoprenylcysteine O-methyltransferase Ste14